MRLHLFLAMLLIGMVPLFLINWILLDTTLQLEMKASTLEMQGQAPDAGKSAVGLRLFFKYR